MYDDNHEKIRKINIKKFCILIIITTFCWFKGFSEDNVFKHLEHLASQPHPVGSPGHHLAASYLEAQLTAWGIPFDIQQALVSEKVGTRIIAANVKNICVRLQGTEGKNTILFSAHYDSVANSPGAGDNAASVAVLLEAIQLAAGKSYRNDLIFLFADAEELQLLGAKAFVERHPWAKEVDLFFNFEGRGNAGSPYAFQSTPDNLNLMAQVAEALPWMKGTSIANDLFEHLPNLTDFRQYRRLTGAQGVGFANIGGPANYHASTDRWMDVSPSTMTEKARNVRALIDHFGSADLRERVRGQAVFFHLPWGVVVYSQRWNQPLLVLAFFLVAAVFVAAGIRKKFRLKPFLLAVILWLPVFFSGAVVTGGLWQLGRFFAPQMGQNLPGHPHDTALFFVGLVLITLGLGGALVGWYVRERPLTMLCLALLLWWTVLAGLVAWVSPGSQYAVTLPVLFFAPAMLLTLTLSHLEGKRGLLVLIAAGLPALVLLLPLCDAIYLALPWRWILISGGLTALCFSFILPGLLCLLQHRKWLARVCVAAGVGCLLVGILQNRSVSRTNPTQASLSYGADHETQEAFWLSSDHELCEWTKPLFQNAQIRAPYFLPGIPWPYVFGKTGYAPMAAPEVAILADDRVAQRRHLKLRIQSRIGAENMLLAFAQESPILSFAIGGERFHRLADPLHIFGVPEDGLVCDIELPATREAHLTLVELKRGLPAVIQRPPHIAPDLRLPFYQDVTLSLRKLVF